MPVEETIRSRINTLIEEARQLSVGTPKYNQCRSETHRQDCEGWLTTALNLLSLVCPDPNSSYRARYQEFINRGGGSVANRHVGEVGAVLGRPLKDLDDGFLTSIADRARGEVLDDLLDQGELYLKKERKDGSGIIVGVVFEDSIRRVCRKRGIVERDKNLDQLISALSSAGVLTPTKAKRARAAGDVRTKATHAQWGEFDLKDVKASIDFTREFIAAELET
jgi:hypothetical protein